MSFVFQQLLHYSLAIVCYYPVNRWSDGPLRVAVPTTQTQQSTSSDVSACEADCAAHLNFYISYGWQSYAINTTITAATLQKIVYPKYNTTKTRLLQNDLPPGYTLPDRNGEGTVVSTLTVDRGRRGKLTTAL